MGHSLHLSVMPSATGQNWEKYNKTFADDEEPEKKIAPLTDEYVLTIWLWDAADLFSLEISKY